MAGLSDDQLLEAVAELADASHLIISDTYSIIGSDARAPMRRTRRRRSPGPSSEGPFFTLRPLGAEPPVVRQ